jgi:hypothetical protein
MTEQATIVAAFLTGIAGPLIIIFVKNYLDSRKKPDDMVKEAIEVSTLVSAKIEHIKEEFGADRVWISQFHNGGHFYPTGKSIAKFSLFYETVKPGITSIQGFFQNIPVALFSKSVNELLENDIVSITDFKDEKVATFGLKYIAEDYGCKSVYLFAIKSIDGKFIGTLGLDFTKRKTTLSIEDSNHLLNYATSIGGVLMNHLQN